ncbi:hypothetical protein ACFL4W_03065 [Planctomycetota bacterium]
MSGVVIREEDGYLISYGDGEKRLTDFTVTFINKYIDLDRDMRFQVLLNHDKQEKGPFNIEAKNFSGIKPFREWVAYKILSVFEGTDRDLQELVKYWGRKYDVKEITITDSHGNIEEDMWVFDNGVIKEGKIIMADDKGVSWLKG